ncbi:MAG: hypothetical protein FWD66_10475 [Paludibacter sp.]|nr:hypothetical protein [Paludibacter sp.]
MNSTFKCWLIANFEITFCIITLIVGSISFFIFADKGNVGVVRLYLFTGFFLFALNVPTKNGTFQYGKYIVMLGFIILVTIFGTKTTDISNHTLGYRVIMLVIWISFVIANGISAWMAHYTYNNMDEVLSLRMFWRNSNVSLFEITWKYTLDRFCNISFSIETCILWLALIIAMSFGG